MVQPGSQACRKVTSNPLGFAGVPADSPLLRQNGSSSSDAAPVEATCSLRFLASRLFLVSFLASTESDVARHFIRHYMDAVGVPPAHMRLFVHEASGVGDAAVRSILEAAGVPHRRVLRVNGTFTERLRLSTINRAVSELPSGAWVIHADVDEFFAYPCDLEQQIAQRHDEVLCAPETRDEHDINICAEMQDRLSGSGRVVALSPSAADGLQQQHAVATHAAIGAQFPLTCYLRQNFWLSSTRPPVSKVVLMKVETAQGRKRAWVDSHHLAGYRRYGMRCRALGYFAHFTLTRQALRTTRQTKLARGHVYRRDISQRSLYVATADFMEAHIDRDARPHAWCQPPPTPAPRDVTLFTNSLLDYCGAPPTRLGGARAV